MWYELGVAYIAGLSVVDFMIYNYIGFKTNVSDVDYGIIGGLWSAVFIATSELLGRLADRGSYRGLSEVSLIFLAMAAAAFALSRNNVAVLAAAYMFHAVAVSTANLGFSAGLFEMSPDSEWESKSYGQRLGLFGLRGLGLLIISLALPFISAFGLVEAVVIAGGLVGLAFVIALPREWPLFERRLHGILTSLTYVSAYRRAVEYFAYGKYGLLSEVPTSLRRGHATLSLPLSALFTTFVGDYYVTALPLVLRDINIGLREYAIAFGVAGLSAAAGLAILGSMGENKAVTSVGIIARGAWAILAIRFISSIAGIVMYISVLVLLFSLLDVSLYKMYIKASGGYGVHQYMVLREMGSLIGSIAGGVALSEGPVVFIATPAVATAAAALSLLA